MKLPLSEKAIVEFLASASIHKKKVSAGVALTMLGATPAQTFFLWIDADARIIHYSFLRERKLHFLKRAIYCLDPTLHLNHTQLVLSSSLRDQLA